jgi:pyruvate dehydrogenase E2 component (dihydrolipoamide acetyltransferase)
MAREFRFPSVGSGLVEGEVVKWLVEVGDRVERDQPLVEIETEKSVIELPSPFAGVVLRRGADEGATIRVGDVLVVIGDEGETPEVSVTRGGREEAIAATTAEGPSSGIPHRNAGGQRDIDPVMAMPLVRKLAREHGIDLSTVEGTGSGGQITRADVEAAVVARRNAKTLEQEASSPESGPVDTDARVRMSKLRRTIAERMTRSWSEVPHITSHDEVDATGLLELRSTFAEIHGEPLPLEAVIIKAVVPALVAYPEFNATLEGEDLILRGRYDVGVAVDTSEGLIVPIVRGADQLSLPALADRVVQLAQKAKARTLTPNELAGGTFTLSNIGAIDRGFGHGVPIVPHGTTAILSVGRIQDRAVVRRGEVVAAPMVPLDLSCDHRVIDGGQNRRFMNLVRGNLEDRTFLAGL